MEFSNTKHDCCSPQQYIEESCPNCKSEAKDVSNTTLEQFIKKEYKNEISSLDGFHFCKTSNCEVVYFKKNEIIKEDKLIKQIGLKEWVSPSTVCYCFNWTKEKMKEELTNTGETNAIKDISSKMNTDKCNCIINNPSGKCCLKDVKQAIKELM